MQEASPKTRPLANKLVAAAAVLAAIGYALLYSPVPLCVLLGLCSALFSLKVGEQGVDRYGRRVPVTEMLELGRQGDRQMLLGGIAGYLMLVFFALAAGLGWWL